jgi:hypothetical protein
MIVVNGALIVTSRISLLVNRGAVLLALVSLLAVVPSVSASSKKIARSVVIFIDLSSAQVVKV